MLRVAVVAASPVTTLLAVNVVTLLLVLTLADANAGIVDDNNIPAVNTPAKAFL
jgi:hypothetical protein